jgi:alpha-mannosidase|tara:strand:- start:2577 stop:2792 length:216 start_codon:yes stop_codon:yes gene_type:complete
MSTIWVADQLKKRLKEKMEDTQSQLVNGVQNFEEYQYLRGRYNSLVDVEQELRELLERIEENDEEQQGFSA